MMLLYLKWGGHRKYKDWINQKHITRNHKRERLKTKNILL
jgi:hypothetical protein